MELNSKENSIKSQILVVEDSYESVLYIKSILDSKSYNVLEVNCGEKALEIIDTQPIDLVITDYLMPKMNGYELIKEIRKRNYNFPIIVITAMESSSKKLDILRLGIDNYIQKPYFKEEITAVVDRALVYHKTLLQNVNSKSFSQDPNETEIFKRKFENILFANIDNHQFGVEDIADEFDISSRTLTRKTKAVYGQTPNQLILEFRLRRAKDIITQYPRTSLTQLTKMVGLKNSSYLKKRLKNRYS
ncbi:response regulator [Ochrovirga pacifica]|uniref:response regulator n=1 Tax=Ochrovirga pacifica TaxID=1042376 RepID=UPI000255A513|nr:response regulator [Ochrovirga pacifica]